MAAQFTVLIMAAGRGTRMRSALPKVLHPVCGKPMLEWVVDAAREAGAARVLCVTRPGDGVAGNVPDDVEVVEQSEGEGTGAAVLAARAQLEQSAAGPVVILSGDHPLVSAEHISGLLAEHLEAGAAATVLTTDQLDPVGYGRVIRGADGSVERIVETKRTEGVPAAQLAIREVNLGTYAFGVGELLAALDEVGLEDGERYLPGALPAIRAAGGRIVAHATDDADIAIGVNDRVGLMEAERVAQRRILERHAYAGVTFQQPATARIEAGVEIGGDTTIGPGVTLAGGSRVGAGCRLGPHSTLDDATVGDGARIVESHLIDSEVGAGASVLRSYLTEAEVQAGATIGPFSYLRPGTVVREGAKVGTFVEVKNSDVGAGAKIPHLSYVGDTDVGEGSNLGASTITANYDGRRKHRTTVGRGVRTGVHTSLIAPVDVGDGAYTGAGSVIDEDVPEGALGIARSRQTNVEGYADRAQEDSGE